MKTRFLILLTTLLMLVGVSANAQYYWYVGTTEPTAASNPATDPGWTELSSKPDKIPIFAEDPNWNDVQWYLAAPAEWEYDTTVNGVQVGGWTKSTVTINGISYNVWTAQSLTDTVNTTLTKLGNSTDPTYYWYAGTTVPTAENISTIATGSETSKPDWSEPQSIKATNNTGESAYLYYCFPTDWNIRILDSDKTTEMSLAQEGTFTYDGISYTVQRTGRKISNGNSKDFYATTTAGEPKYYWYAGPDMLTSTTIPGSGTVYPMTTTADSQIGWHIIDGEPTSIETGDLANSEKINWTLAVPTSLGLNHVSNGEDVTDLYTVSTVTCADGVSYKVFRQIEASKRIAVIFVKGSSDETKYYWYAGTTLPTADNIASIAIGSSNRIQQWDGKEFSITNSGEESTPAYVCTPVDFKVIWKDTNGFDLHLPVVSRFEYEGTIYTVRKRGRNLSAGAEFHAVAYYSDDFKENFWYAGPEMQMDGMFPGSGTVYLMTTTSEDQIGWHEIFDTPSYVETGQVNYGEKINWVLAIPTALGLNHISNGVDDVTSAYDVSTVTAADGVEYTVFRQISQSKKTDRAFVDGETKYYWYYGTTLPTEENLTSIAGWSEDYPYGGFYLGLRAKLYNDTEQSADMYICTPAIYKNQFVWKDAGGAVDLIDVSTFTCGSIEYKVQKLASPLGAGEKKYIYAMESGDNITMSIDKSKAFLEKNHTMTLKATLNPTYLSGSDSNNSMTWKSSNTAVATVSKSGEVTGLKAGTAKITCTSNTTGLKVTCKVTVGYVKLSKTEVAIEKGKTLTLKSKVYPSTVKDQSVTWESSDPTIVKVASSGKIKGMKAGKATITCTSNATGLKATCEVTVGYVKLNYTALTVEKGKVVALKSKVYPTTEDQSVTWESSDPTIVKVASTGKIKGLKTGTAIITCTSNATGLSATCKVTVVKASAAPSMDGTDDDVTGIEEKPALAEEFDVYDLNGRKVLNKVTSLDGLSNGVYIVNGKKVLRQ